MAHIYIYIEQVSFFSHWHQKTFRNFLTNGKYLLHWEYLKKSGWAASS